MPQFSTHTTRHLCLTDLARMGWELHAIATFAGHRSTETTLTYIHLSGRELADKLARGMDHIHVWRVEMLARLGEHRDTVADDDVVNSAAVGSAAHLLGRGRCDVNCFRRHERLSKDEFDALQDSRFRPAAARPGPRTPGNGRRFWRLTAPLDEALAVLHWHPDTVFQRRFARYATAIVLHHCGELGRDFWSWSTQRVGRSAAPTAAAAAIRGAGRHAGTSLSPRPRLSARPGSPHSIRSGRSRDMTLAQRVFGADLVEEAIEPVRAVLSWMGIPRRESGVDDLHVTAAQP